MRHRTTTLLALTLALVAAAGVASACPYSRTMMTVSPRPYLPISKATITIERADPRFDAIEARGPALWSADDVVGLEVVEHAGGRVVLSASRTLEAGHVYQLAFTRSETGQVLPTAQIVGVNFRAVGHGGCSAQSCFTMGLLGKLATFAFLPFGLGYALTRIIIRRRRTIWSVARD